MLQPLRLGAALVSNNPSSPIHLPDYVPPVQPVVTPAPFDFMTWISQNWMVSLLIVAAAYFIFKKK